MKNTYHRLLIITSILFLLLVNSTSAYTATRGVEIGDTLDLVIYGELDNGEVFQPRTDFQATVAYDGSLIEGFVDCLIGMKLETTKDCRVPVGKGYDSGQYANQPLNFEIKLKSVVGYTPAPGELGPEINQQLVLAARVLGVIGGLIVLIIAIVYFSRFFQKTTGHHCFVCGITYEGQCANCDTPYCRKDFGKRCKNCKSNRFIPK